MAALFLKEPFAAAFGKNRLKTPTNCWWFRNPAFTTVEGKVVFLIMTRFLYIPAGAGFPPSTVWFPKLSLRFPQVFPLEGFLSSFFEVRMSFCNCSAAFRFTSAWRCCCFCRRSWSWGKSSDMFLHLCPPQMEVWNINLPFQLDDFSPNRFTCGVLS